MVVSLLICEMRQNNIVAFSVCYHRNKTAEKLICFLLGSGDHILEDVAVKERELFISDATDVYPASALR